TADDITQGLPRVEEIFEVRTPKGQAFLSEIAGTVSTWEEGDHYVVQVSGEDGEKAAFKLEGRKPKVKNGAEVAIGDVIASNDDGENPLVTNVGGKVELTKTKITVTPNQHNTVRYEIPGF